MTRPIQGSGGESPSGGPAAGRGGSELDEPRRREIFRALVELQDREPSVSKARSEIARRYALTERLLRRIEEEGVENDWPPL